MIWKPTALAAVVVAIVGVAAGALIGGHTTVRVIGNARPAGARTSASAPGSTGTPATPSAAARDGATRGVPVTQVRVTQDTRNSQTDSEVAIENDESGVPVQLQDGLTQDDSLKFGFGADYDKQAADYYELQLPVPAKATRFEARIGFLKGDPPDNNVEVTFYKNEVAKQNLMQRYEVKSSAGGQPVELTLAGVRNIMVRFVCTNTDQRWSEPNDEDPMFGFQSPQFFVTS